MKVGRERKREEGVEINPKKSKQIYQGLVATVNSLSIVFYLLFPNYTLMTPKIDSNSFLPVCNKQQVLI